MRLGAAIVIAKVPLRQFIRAVREPAVLATLNSFLPAGLGPIGVAVIFGVDELMDMGRTCVNLIGNCLATVVVARWEGEFDDTRARVFGTSAEAEVDLKPGDIAFAEAVRQD